VILGFLSPVIRRKAMLELLILIAAQGAVAEDEAQFNRAWAQRPPTQAEWPFSKAMAFDLYEWSQAQFALGYCSEFYTSSEAGRMRVFPNEQEISRSRLGQGLIATAQDSFKKGVEFRKSVKPTPAICQKQMAARGEVLKAITSR
jgi:hypothetical protein